jgi:hypothetical protein
MISHVRINKIVPAAHQDPTAVPFRCIKTAFRANSERILIFSRVEYDRNITLIPFPVKNIFFCFLLNLQLGTSTPWRRQNIKV